MQSISKEDLEIFGGILGNSKVLESESGIDAEKLLLDVKIPAAAEPDDDKIDCAGLDASLEGPAIE